MNDLSKHELELLNDLFDFAADRLRHYEDGELDWDEEDRDAFWGMYRKLDKRAKELGAWWAR